MIDITPEQRRALRAAAHHRNPVVTVAGKGLTDNVLAEIDGALKAHELIKVKLQGFERTGRESLLGEICAQMACAAVQHIGTVLVLWRPNPEAKPVEAPTTRARPAARPRPQAGYRPAGRQDHRRRPGSR
jgi:putative YhbY family RNA-binding protein